ncbi:MAG: SDR family oxidoreductase [Spirochaetaceae bacterium]|jgi:3-oxoacyl-[acyl-carrier protein] reductase|nr:SDR family oxidoreductase [Spirochaetaceae bacterium]
MEIDLTNKTALVTGAAGQLGRVMARTLASCGAKVFVHYLKNKAGADTVVREIRSGGGEARAVQGDITDRESMEALRRDIREEVGDPDIVVNNAVSQYTWTSILEQDLDDFEDQFKSVIMQNVLSVKLFLPGMIAKGSGRFIGINTECSYLCNANSGAYAQAKRGLDGLYRVLAKEAGPHNITVNQVAPGWTISDKDRENHTEIAPEYTKNVPLGRRGTDQEIANAVAFLASDLASFITGVCIPVCGGTVMV